MAHPFLDPADVGLGDHAGAAGVAQIMDCADVGTIHDLRHTRGTRMIAEADIRRVQEWMGHADIQTTIALSARRAPQR